MRHRNSAADAKGFLDKGLPENRGLKIQQWHISLTISQTINTPINTKQVVNPSYVTYISSALENHYFAIDFVTLYHFY